jgi:hypothetical protein
MGVDAGAASSPFGYFIRTIFLFFITWLFVMLDNPE